MEKALEKLEQEDDNSTLPNELTWTQAQESILVEWADKAACYRWLHDGSERYYQRLNNWLTIPVIAMSTAAGTANFGVTSLVPPYSNAASYVIGCFTLLSGLITTLAKFLRVGEKIEAHHSASMSWGKLHRLISVELSLRRDQRVNCQDFIKIARAEVDRLIEMSPMTPELILQQFRHEFRDNKELRKPEICNGIDHTVVCLDTHTNGRYSQGTSSTSSSTTRSPAALAATPISEGSAASS
jgi:hypothetical protein